MSGKVISGNITYDQDEGFWHNIWNKLSDIASGIGHVAATVAPYAAAGLSAAARQYGNTPSSPSADFRRPVKTLVSYLPPQQPVTLLPEILPTTRLPLDFIPEPLKQAERPKQSYWPSANPEAWETPARQAMQALSASSNFSQEAQRPLQKNSGGAIPNPLHTAPMTDTIAPATLPPATYTDHYHMQTDLWPKVQTGEMLSDAEMKQLFHSIDLHRYGAQSQAQHMQADAAQAYAEQKLAEAMIRNALRTPTGEVLFSRVPIASQDALKVALQDVRHFQKTDLHLTPGQVRTAKDGKNKNEEMNKYYFQRKQFAILKNHGYPNKEILNILKAEGESYEWILSKYKPTNSNRIDWYEFSDIVDYIANTSKHDEIFRMQLWLLFGTNVHSPLNQFLDNTNKYLPKKYHNTGKYYYHNPEEQMHHYLGGVTGNLENSQNNNEPVQTWWFELQEKLRHGDFNQGDFDMFQDIRKHRDDFRNAYPYGRFTVGRNIRRILFPK